MNVGRVILGMAVVVALLGAGAFAWTMWWKPSGVEVGGGVIVCAGPTTHDVVFGEPLTNRSSGPITLQRAIYETHGVTVEVVVAPADSGIGSMRSTDISVVRAWARSRPVEDAVIARGESVEVLYRVITTRGGWVDGIGATFRTADGATRTETGSLLFGLRGPDLAQCVRS